jgi:hypothetical protein
MTVNVSQDLQELYGLLGRLTAARCELEEVEEALGDVLDRLHQAARDTTDSDDEEET